MHESTQPGQLLNHFRKSGGVTRKDRLLRNLRKMSAIHGGVYAFFPPGFILPEEYTKFVKAYAAQEVRGIWICKPSDMSRGRKIFLIRDLDELTYDQQYIVQRYISRPLTVDGYKLDLRVYVLSLSFHPINAYIYTDGLVRFGSNKYDGSGAALHDLFSHLTNSSINKHSSSYRDDKGVIGRGCKWQFAQLADWLRSKGVDYDALWGRIEHVIMLTLLMVHDDVPRDDNCFELFGFDIMLDRNLKPWIIEVNASPALSAAGRVDHAVKGPLLSDMMDVLQYWKYDHPGVRLSHPSRRKAAAAKVAAARKRRGRASKRRPPSTEDSKAKSTGGSGSKRGSRSEKGEASTMLPPIAKPGERRRSTSSSSTAAASATATTAATAASTSSATSSKRSKPRAAASTAGKRRRPSRRRHSAGAAEVETLEAATIGAFKRVFPYDARSAEQLALLEALSLRSKEPLKVRETMREIVQTVKGRDRPLRARLKGAGELVADDTLVGGSVAPIVEEVPMAEAADAAALGDTTEPASAATAAAAAAVAAAVAVAEEDATVADASAAEVAAVDVAAAAAAAAAAVEVTAVTVETAGAAAVKAETVAVDEAAAVEASTEASVEAAAEEEAAGSAEAEAAAT
eukprot:PLAT2509.1.p1 GENE.PLAT2509.1~~PLAT2509.1.p1  ORF type:complete len:628 (+),score=200.62 PLAT2509.1:272-2155(+)